MYLGELAPKNMRGAIGIVPQLFITVGILSAQVLGITNILGNSTGWPLMLGLTGIPALVELLLLPFFPESPRYLLIQKGDERTAKRGETDDTQQVFIVEASGRKLLLLIGFGICCGACVVLTVALRLQDSVNWMPHIIIACVIMYVIGHSIGPSPISVVVTTEMFRQSSRSAVFMVAGSVHWLSNFTVGLVFPFMEKGLGPYSFLIFSVICLVTLIYTWLVLPETKNNTFLEISQMFAKRNKVEIKLGDENSPTKQDV
ncbi:solute carrier family 2, facilitated glucose transporter member 5-like [Hypomesus transpacificus]|uniref:solute carrier family 2, facilitated glucose transporter member 5-like n=1 Tax=Hypomesus transpacificus TaxID=137520 RepID=UPI001F07CEF9|nr:solute carrier family 2, facilitated glucose transporter member 5-like [Hypomesus transpacificus]